MKKQDDVNDIKKDKNQNNENENENDSEKDNENNNDETDEESDDNENDEKDNNTKQPKKQEENEKDDNGDEEKGEICVRGRHLMMGYLYNNKKSEKSIDEDGYLHTGDLGRIDSQTNFVFITGREKDLIITQGGENVAPSKIEKYMKQNNSNISNCVVIGDDKKYLTLLVTLKNYKSNKKNIKSSIQNTLNNYNNDQDYCVSNAQKIQKFKILKHDFSEQNNEITPTMKIKRNEIIKNYVREIESMYE